jgi:hypothetical protein
MFRSPKFFHALVLAYGLLASITGTSASETKFKIDVPPTAAEWQHFNRMNAAQLKRLWSYQENRGFKGLGDWAWQWRMGWMRRCSEGSMPELCTNLILQGLKDEAMVVRAEAANTIAVIYRGKPDPTIIKELSNAYADPRNVRNGSPLFVCDRILSALHNMGGPLADTTAIRLANKFPTTAAYWSKVRRQNP